MIKKKATEEKWVLMTELNGEQLLHHFKFSNLGNVVRIKKGVGVEEPFIPKEIGGYQYISFTTRNGSRETIYLHRLVAEFFVDSGDNPDATFVIHKDYNRRNNNFDNLQWVTQEVLYKHRASKAGRIHSKEQNRKKAIRADHGASNELTVNELAVQRQLVAEYLGVAQ